MNPDIADLEKFSHLPVCRELPQICQAVTQQRRCIIHAAPGAGKTMLVPVALKRVMPGKILLMEPRRIAAKGAASGIAAMQNWQLGKEVGFKVRGENVCAPDTGIVSATCGMVLNMLRHDPELSGFDAVIFDEFHERGAEQELVFALLDEVRQVLHEDLALVIMSATLDENISRQLPQFPVIRVPGREFPVEMIHREISKDTFALPGECAKAVLSVFNSSSGDILLFLPGKNEIARCQALLDGALENCCIMPLHGGLPLAEQSRVLKKLPDGKRKIVLATNIAESSLTIEGISVVIDSGYERKMHFAPGMGMPVLELSRISLDSAVQRSGRAGRTAPGTALRLWTKQEEMGFLRSFPPEITRCDLSRTVLEIAHWGTAADKLNWLTPPPESSVAAAVKTVQALGLMDENRRLTDAGRKAIELPLHPRLGAMLIYAGKHNMLPLACPIAALLEDGDLSRRNRGNSCDIREILHDYYRHPEHFPAVRQSCRRLRDFFRCPEFDGDDSGAGVLLGCAYPEYVGKARSRHGVVYQLSGGRTAEIREDDELRKEEFLAIAGVSMGAGKAAHVQAAAPLTLEELTGLFEDRFTEHEELEFDADSGRVSGSRESRFGALVISSSSFVPDGTLTGKAVLSGALKRKLELFPAGSAAHRLLCRVRFAGKNGDETMPDWSSENFNRILLELSEPFLAGVKDFNALLRLNWLEILKSGLDYFQINTLNKLYPDKYLTPAGTEIAIDYSGEQPTLQVPIQQLYGETVHPAVGRNQLPLRLELLSPARRPVQITCDLPGFWQGSWSLVRSEMRSRYPKHDWPEHPETVPPRRSSVKKR